MLVVLMMVMMRIVVVPVLLALNVLLALRLTVSSDTAVYASINVNKGHLHSKVCPSK